MKTIKNIGHNKWKCPISTISLIAVLVFSSCNNNDKNYDASGSFEADETIIASEAVGTLKQFNIEEGQKLKKDQLIGYVDSTQLHLKKQQLVAQISAARSRKPDIAAQLATFRSQLKTAKTEQNRILNLVSGGAATQKQLDDINAEIDLLNKQITAQKTTLYSSAKGINNDALSLEAQVEQLNDQLAKSKIVNPINGTVLVKYAMENEMATNGKPLYKIADLSNITLRAYITGNQLPQVRLNQSVTVFTDDGNGGFNQTEGTITWISSKAEFTPKTIQTKDERANLVYAIKVKVKNNGTYKIGMYGEIKF
ncbi:MAG: HlyD family secretion protein [Flavobacteriaceae bacterium]